MFGCGENKVYASTSFSARATDSWPKGQRIFFRAKSWDVDISSTR